MVSPCEGNPGGFYFLGFVDPYYISLSVMNMAAFIRHRDCEGGSAPTGGMRCVTVAVGGDTRKSAGNVAPRAWCLRRRSCRPETGLWLRGERLAGPSLETKVRADVQRSSWALRKVGASEISQRHYGDGGGGELGQVPLDIKSPRIGVKKKAWMLY